MELITKKDFQDREKEIFSNLGKKYPGVTLVNFDHTSSIGIYRKVSIDGYLDGQRVYEFLFRANLNHGAGYKVTDPMQSSPEFEMRADDFVYEYGFVLEHLDETIKRFHDSLWRFEKILRDFKIPYNEGSFQKEEEQNQSEN